MMRHAVPVAMTLMEEIDMTYTAVARRSGGWWAVSVPQLKGVHTQARRLDQVEAMAREAIALMLDRSPASVVVTVEPVMPAEAAAARKARQSAKLAEQRADQATATAVAKLLGAGYTVRDAGKLLDLSPQRVSQIAKRRGDGSKGKAARKKARAAT